MKNKIFFIFFITIWIILILLNIFVPKKNFSNQENRYLAKIPEFSFKELVNGKYAQNLDNYINDHFIARDFWIKLNSYVHIKLGKKENNGIYIGKDNFLFEKITYRENEKENLKKISLSINNFSKSVNIPIYFMLVPNSNYIYKDKLPENVDICDQSKIIDEFYKKLDPSIEKINVVDILKDNKNKYNLYFKTDHHIKSIGAYFLYTEFCKIAKLEATDLSNFTKEIVSKDFLGTFDSKAQVFNQLPDEIEVYKNEINRNVKVNYDGIDEDSIFNEAFLKKKDKYSYFLNGNNAKVVIKTEVKNGKKLLIIKDSYAHIFSQFICQNYQEIHFLDPRYYKASYSDYIHENNINEVLFLYNFSNIITDLNLTLIK